MALTKSELVSIIANHTGLTKKETQAVIDGFLNTMRHGLQRRKRVELRGFGNFKVVHRQARMARNPLSNEPVYVAEHDTVVFRPSQHLKDYLNTQADEKE
jgi:DNA-binding protein HU-beta